MKILSTIKYLLAIAAIVFIFFNWHVSIVLFIIGTLLHVFPLGPNPLLSVITGELIIAGAIFMFINWKIGVALIIGGFLVTKFRVWGNKKNYEYYVEKNKNEKEKKEK
ncbi:MAG: hypothetical protein COV59_02120 [Candidatus Magasanikbacteria bacterium CG11_big_fil_rev_8_21_14_0_20_39_34]|uniref:Uncharacterized protein n=1 Tax=Candidatus Magasanikbacteria bacterium CG11_big_fil_rev_8_21_14_0_20_39_34 TaxID=1974653 RepID=A0A2H0N4Y7_9BACT|nr:MAG: hypothetical protein COV59_02120 [Candidatus Magasanikbacteria bacterium CG11_big_fil_rev_8_21_14_0_20_39_34]